MAPTVIEIFPKESVLYDNLDMFSSSKISKYDWILIKNLTSSL